MGNKIDFKFLDLLNGRTRYLERAVAGRDSSRQAEKLRVGGSSVLARAIVA